MQHMDGSFKEVEPLVIFESPSPESKNIKTTSEIEITFAQSIDFETLSSEGENAILKLFELEELDEKSEFDRDLIGFT